MNAPYFDDDDTCDECLGEGGWHDCGEDTCCCLDPEDRTSLDWIVCGVCGGSGRIGDAQEVAP